MRLDSKTIVLIVSCVAALAGGTEMRVAVGRLETSVTNIEKRVERIEKDFDSRHSFAALETE